MTDFVLLNRTLMKIARGIADPKEFAPIKSMADSDLPNQLVGMKIGKLTLKRDHIVILAFMIHKALEGSTRIDPLPFLKELYGKMPRLSQMDRMVELIDAGILSCEEMKFMTSRGRCHPLKRLALDRVTLVGSCVFLRDTFLSQVLNARSSRLNCGPKPFRTNQQFLDLWFLYVNHLLIDNQFSDEDGPGELIQGRAIKAKFTLDSRLNVTTKEFPLQRLTNKYSLNEQEQLILVYVLHETIRSEGCRERDLRVLVSHLNGGAMRPIEAMSPHATLRREGLILPANSGGFIFDTRDFEIAPDVADYLLNDKPRSAEAVIRAALRNDSLLSYSQPRTNLGQIVLPEQQKATVKEMLARFSNSTISPLAEWGFELEKQRDSRKTSCKRILILLYGSPGTGKTALAHAIAGQLKRYLLTTDISRILGKYVGDSEKNISQLFDTYNRISGRLPSSPVLLFNEADQFFACRGSVSQSVDRMYNAMQNLMLERLENFGGIFIATTNLIDNLDRAFSRRFDLKLELGLPGVDQRRQLWKLLMPPKLPLHADVDIDALSERFQFTGAQIETVIRNTAVAVASRSQSSQIVRQQDVLKFAVLEEQSCFDENQNRRIGFSRQ